MVFSATVLFHLTVGFLLLSKVSPPLADYDLHPEQMPFVKNPLLTFPTSRLFPHPPHPPLPEPNGMWDLSFLYWTTREALFYSIFPGSPICWHLSHCILGVSYPLPPPQDP